VEGNASLQAYQIIAAGLDKLQEYENCALMNPTYVIATSKHVYIK
jgi:hypothetical protein